MLSRLLALRVDLRDPEAAAEVTPESLAAYAARAGWQHAATTSVYRIHERPDAGLRQVLVPIHADWPDYGACVLHAITTLAEHEGRSPLAVWADLVGLTGAPEPTPGKAPPRREVAPGEAIGALDDLRPVPPAAQAVLPGLDGGGPDRRTTRHVFGGFEARELPAGPLAPEATVTNLARSCRHCDCLHRVASAGPRLGKEDLYSTDGGKTWSTTSPPCIEKR